MYAIIILSNIFYINHIQISTHFAIRGDFFEKVSACPFLYSGSGGCGGMIIYKPITSALKRVGLSAPSAKKTDVEKFILLAIGAITLLVIAVLVILFMLNGEFQMFAKK